MKQLAKLVRAVAKPLGHSREDYDQLLDWIGNARFVLLGESTHGTHEFYRERAEITKRLIREKGFNAVAIEADWPATHRLNRYVLGTSDDADSLGALGDFTRFPCWVWRNADMADFIGWMRSHNDAQDSRARKGRLYGLDLYGLNQAIHAVIGYLDRVDPAAAKEARQRYACFGYLNEQRHRYGFGAALGLEKTCEEEAVTELVEMRRREAELIAKDPDRIGTEEDWFSAEQNALLIEDAERFYRAMFRERATAWNQRDGHMAEALAEIADFLQRKYQQSKIVVWAHNAHIGDGRAVTCGEGLKINLGQLVKEKFHAQAVSVGFTTYSGTVTAAADWWDSPPQRKPLPPAVEESYEAVFHEVGFPRSMLNLREQNEAVFNLGAERLERTIGVIYRPETDVLHAYTQARIAKQFDALIHIDQTRAVEPLDHLAAWDTGDVPATFPVGV